METNWFLWHFSMASVICVLTFFTLFYLGYYFAKHCMSIIRSGLRNPPCSLINTVTETDVQPLTPGRCSELRSQPCSAVCEDRIESEWGWIEWDGTDGTEDLIQQILCTTKRDEDQIQRQTTASPSCHILAGNRTPLHFLGQIDVLERCIWKIHSMFNEVLMLLLQLLGALHNENNHTIINQALEY